MVRPHFILFAMLLLGAAGARSGEEYMPMHPGSNKAYARYNEVGMGMVAGPIRRATSEDQPRDREDERPLRRNTVKLKIPPAQTQGSGRLRMVQAKINEEDGTLDFDLENATAVSHNLDIPGLVSPEYLAMDRLNTSAARMQHPPREPRRVSLPDPVAPGELEMPQSMAAVVERAPEKAVARARVTITQPEAAPVPAAAPEALASLRVPELSGDGGAAATVSAAPLAMPSFAPLSRNDAALAIRPPDAGAGMESLAPPSKPAPSLRPPSAIVDDEVAVAVPERETFFAGGFGGDLLPRPAGVESPLMVMGPITAATPEVRQPHGESWPMGVPGAGASRKPRARREPAALPDPDVNGLTPIRAMRTINPDLIQDRGR